MQDYSDKIRDVAKGLLEDGKVDVVIGFQKGTIPLSTHPVLIKKADDTGKLYWDSFCVMNLANYVTKRTEKIGIFAKGCDSRNIVNHIVENQIKREQLYIVGIPCHGMLDAKRLLKDFGEEVLEAREEDGKIFLKGANKEESFERNEYLRDNCAICVHRNPVIYDELIGEEVQEQEDVDRFKRVTEIEAKTPEERWEFFKNEFKDCIRCYACRNACPLCYCPTCFVDESRPQWVGKSIDPIDVTTFHFLRAFHCAGRCTDCGACESACPMDIRVRYLTKKLEKDVLDLYKFEAGLSLDTRPPLDVYQVNDPQDFIK